MPFTRRRADEAGLAVPHGLQVPVQPRQLVTTTHELGHGSTLADVTTDNVGFLDIRCLMHHSTRPASASRRPIVAPIR